ncbi:MAG TPA: tol-pal system protein YbgF [Syntrophales bacterium]|nr:tol-pal system protein YbgF [Syntrophales bacterium]
MRNYILLAVVCLLCVVSCATTEDLVNVQRDLKYTNDKVDVTNENVSLLRKENADAKKSKEALPAVRTRQAEIEADITGLRESIQQLTGKIEVLRKDFDSAQVRTSRYEEEIKALKKKLDAVSFKTDPTGKEQKSPETGEKGGTQAAQETTKGKMDKKSAYAAAYDEFKAARYEKARTGFQDFLKQHPETEYSGNALFWIGECYYFEKNYEKAILEYDKVIKKYPDGGKAPSALLKQGLSFINLGDKVSARVVLQRVIKDYPNTSQARTARAKLLKL